MPAKARNLFDDIASFPALHAAALRAARGKRAKPGAAAFLANLEKKVLRLERELRDGSYRPGRYQKIEIFEPKHRVVSAAPFRDRVVHHAFCAVCEPIFERRLHLRQLRQPGRSPCTWNSQDLHAATYGDRSIFGGSPCYDVMYPIGQGKERQL